MKVSRANQKEQKGGGGGSSWYEGGQDVRDGGSWAAGANTADRSRSPRAERRRSEPSGFKLLIEHLPMDMTKEELEDVAQDYGNIKSVTIWKERANDEDYRVGLVEYNRREE